MTPAQDLQAQAAINAHEAIACARTKAHTSRTGVCDDPPRKDEAMKNMEGPSA